jgi:hypothetical protein
MAYSFGGGVNASLGATDYGSFNYGAQMGAQSRLQGGKAIGQGIASAGHSIGQGMQASQDLKERNKAAKGSVDMAAKLGKALKDIPGVPEGLKTTITEFMNMAENPDISVSEKAAAAQMFLSEAPKVLSLGMQASEAQAAQEAQARQMQAIRQAFTPVSQAQRALGSGASFEQLPQGAQAFMPQQRSPQEAAALMAGGGVNPNAIAGLTNAMANAAPQQVDPLARQKTQAEIELLRARTAGVAQPKGPGVVVNMGDMGKMKETAYSKLMDTRTTEVDPIVSTRPAIDAMEVLINNLDDKGQVITGKLANIELGAKSILNAVGLSNFEDVARTQEYIGSSVNLVGQIIKQFGAGTGLSDADREFANKAAAGDITMDRAALQRLVAMAKKVNEFKIRAYNDRVSRTFSTDDDAWARESLVIPTSGGGGAVQKPSGVDIGGGFILNQ